MSRFIGRVPNEVNMDVKGAIDTGNSTALRRLLFEDSSRANELIEVTGIKNAGVWLVGFTATGHSIPSLSMIV